MENLTVAAVCMRSVPGSVEDNFDRLKSMTDEASSGGADVVCFPECTLTGYVLNAVDQAYGSLDLRTAVHRLLPVAEKAGVVVIAGLIEPVSGKKPYITQIVVGPGGLLGRYRKTHLSPPEEAVYQPGQSVERFHVNGTVLGVQLCYEAHFPELSTRMALMGADVIFMPHASPRGTPEEKRQSWMRHLPARAFDNGLFVVACNPVGMSRGGLSFPGVALILGPDGRQVAAYAGDEETILYATLDADLLKRVRGHRMRYFLPRRRPELYR
ncbi:MAG: nitrilase-related carbon-nitrogen hydrolase [Deltaproteobacteria bacterium]|nr:nitrilase-related carbon-nitrogen hydrolase [Deltaproteobacteria bacterium]